MPRFEMGDIVRRREKPRFNKHHFIFVVCRPTVLCGLLLLGENSVGFRYNEDGLIYGPVEQTSDSYEKIGRVEDLSVEELLRWEHLHTYLSYTSGDRKSKYEI